MARTVNIPERTYGSGPQQSSRLNLQPGETRLKVNLTTPSWPATTDGAITLRYLIDRQGPAGAVQEWSDTFQHVEFRRGGVLQTSIDFESKLDQPFVSGDDFIVQKDSTIPVTTAITVVID